MKRYLLLLPLIFVNALHAQQSTLETLYAAQEYDACLRQAQAMHAFEDIPTQTYLSLCAEKEGQDTVAIAALERIMFLEPDNVDAMLRLGRIYQRLRLEDQQALLTNSLKAYQLTPEQRTTLTTLVSKETPSLSKISARVSLGGGYDSDLNILPTTDVIASSYLRFAASLSFVHELESKNGWFVNGGANYQHQSNEAEHLYDIDYIDTHVGVGYKYATMTLTLPLYYRRLEYLDTDLLHEYGITPRLDMMLTKSTLLTLEAMIAKRDFLLESYTPKDFESVGGSLGGVWFFGPDFFFLKSTLKQIRQSNDLPDLFTAKDSYAIVTGGYYRFSSTLGTRVNYRYRVNDFNDYDRRDRNHAFVLALEWTLTKHWRLVGTYKHIVNLSDYDDADYRKHVSELALQYDY